MSPYTEIPASLYPDFPKDRHCVYVPVVHHIPLKGTRDDVFFRLLKMHRIIYDTDSKTGVLFFLLDSIVSGSVSVLCIGTTRNKALEYMIGALNFIFQQFGKDVVLEDDQRPAENLCYILRYLKLELKKEKRGK